MSSPDVLLSRRLNGTPARIAKILFGPTDTRLMSVGQYLDSLGGAPAEVRRAS